MRRIAVLSCPESWDGMKADGDGRYCERCQLRVTEVAQLDEGGLDSLLDQAASERVCARFELDGGRPRTKLGLAAGLVVIALAGCATKGGAVEVVPIDEAAFGEYLADIDDDGAGVIAGIVRTPAGVPVADAVVVLMDSEHTYERLTDARGFYKFEDLPPGTYTVQVYYGKANIAKIVTLPEGAKLRAHFTVDPDYEGPRVLVGAVFDESMIDTSSASSTYGSRLIEYD